MARIQYSSLLDYANLKCYIIFVLDVQNHLSENETTNLGSYYTPLKYVNIAYNWLLDIQNLNEMTFLEPSCGYGSFLSLSEKLSNNYIPNYIDKTT